MHLTRLGSGFRSVEHTDTLNGSPARTDGDGGIKFLPTRPSNAGVR